MTTDSTAELQGQLADLRPSPRDVDLSDEGVMSRVDAGDIDTILLLLRLIAGSHDRVPGKFWGTPLGRRLAEGLTEPLAGDRGAALSVVDVLTRPTVDHAVWTSPIGQTLHEAVAPILRGGDTAFALQLHGACTPAAGSADEDFVSWWGSPLGITVSEVLGAATEDLALPDITLAEAAAICAVSPSTAGVMRHRGNLQATPGKRSGVEAQATHRKASELREKRKRRTKRA